MEKKNVEPELQRRDIKVRRRAQLHQPNVVTSPWVSQQEFLDIKIKIKTNELKRRGGRETIEDREDDGGGIKRLCALLYLYFLSQTPND